MLAVHNLKKRDVKQESYLRTSLICARQCPSSFLSETLITLLFLLCSLTLYAANSVTPLFFSFFIGYVKLNMSEGNSYNLLKSPASDGGSMDIGFDNRGG